MTTEDKQSLHETLVLDNFGTNECKFYKEGHRIKVVKVEKHDSDTDRTMGVGVGAGPYLPYTDRLLHHSYPTLRLGIQRR